MEAQAGNGTDLTGSLVRLQEIDRVRDRLQRRLDQVPVKLKQHTDTIAAIQAELAEQEQAARLLRSEADRAELEIRTLEERREKLRSQMNAPKLSVREYDTLREELAGVIADINSFSDKAIKGMQAAEEAEGAADEVRKRLEEARAAYEEARAQLEGSLSGVKEQLAKHDAEREAFLPQVPEEPLHVYERVRTKHSDALAVVDGTIDRAAGRIGTDLHCSACYMTITANDAVAVLEGKRLVQCKSCSRILYVP